MNLSYFLLGKVTISADRENALSLLNLCMDLNIPYSDISPGEEHVTMCFRMTAFAKMKKEAEKQGITYCVSKKSGVPVFVERYIYRFGMYVGIICSILLVFFAHQFIWDIEVIGNQNITSSEVRDVLREYGFSVGSYIPRINTDRMENKILIDSDNISWISINIIGTVAEVEIREREQPPKQDTSARPANLVAKKSGVIEEVRIFRGKTVVSAGEYVDKGDLLVSGLFDSVQVGFRYTRAAGEVYARTVDEFYIEIPYEYEDKVYTGEEYCNKSLNFFDFSMNISQNGGNEGSFYDKIDIVEDFTLFGVIKTPFSVHTERFLEYETVWKTRTPEAAEELAYISLENQLSELSEDTVVLKKTITPYAREDRFLLHCVIVLIEDIASVSEFDVVLK